MTDVQDIGSVVVGYLSDKEEGWEALVLQTEDGDTLEMQCSLEDNLLEQESHCVVVHAGPACDGAVEEWEVGSGQIRLSFTAKGQQVLEMPRTIVCALSEEGQTLTERHLPRILRR